MSIKQNVESFYPLSSTQQSMLFHTLYDIDSGTYVEQLSMLLQGNLDAAALQRAWYQVVERHPIFRTSFIWEGLESPIQVVYRHVEVPWQIEDWRSLSPDAQAARLTTFLNADRQRGYVLNHAPLMRLALFHMAADSYQLVWSRHPMLLDGWSVSLVLGEVLALYGAFARHDPLHLPAPRPYRDYVTWLQQQDLRLAEAFWRQYLAGFCAATPLGVDRADAVTGMAEYEEQERRLPDTTSRLLEILVSRHELSLSTIVQGAWALLLACYSGETDVVWGMTVSGRPAELIGVEQMVGLFSNTVPVRVGIDRTASLLTWLQSLQAQQPDLGRYQHTPTAQIQSWAEVARGQPLFESIVAVENLPPSPVTDASGAQHGLVISGISAGERTSSPLTLIANVAAIRLNYDRRRFDVTTISRMLDHLETLLTSIATQPEQRLADLSPLTAAERQQIAAWNLTAAAYPEDQCIHQLFEQQVARTPSAVAVVCGNARLSYAELNERADDLARYLRAEGVGPDVRVALCVSRSLDLAVGLLGILKAGGACVPLNPADPATRMQSLLSDTKAAVLITQHALVASLPPHRPRLVCLDTDWNMIRQARPAEQSADPGPDQLAYVVYPSRSLGQPKGVAMSHRPLVNLIAWHLRHPPFDQPCRTLQFASLSFDAAFQECFTTWSSGGTLIMITDEQRRDMGAVLQVVRDAAVERIFVPFVALQQLAELAVTTDAPCVLRQVIATGEQLRITPAIARWLTGLPDCMVHHQYGPTESHVITTYTLEGVPATWPTLPPIGQPIANAQAYLLDAQLQPVPIGVTGDLYLGGVALARGYLDRPALTAERFLPHPWSDQPGARLYKTGDMGRYWPDGNIEYVGRNHQHVKVRGYRIEVGEIEAVLQQHERIQAAAVVVCEDTSGEERLVAYVVEKQDSRRQTKNQTAIHESELFALLKAHLPDYMVPSMFVALETLPLTPSGKIDRVALRAPDTLQPARVNTCVPPRTPVEALLVQVWAEVLQIDRVGVYDSFFDLGGHSLVATLLMSRVREVCLIDLPLRCLFETPTIVGLVEQLMAAHSLGAVALPPALQPVARDQALPVSVAQQLWILNRLDPNSPAYTISSALRLTGSLNPAALEQSLNEIARRHEVLRTTFDHQDGDPTKPPVQLIVPFAPIPLTQIDLQGLPEAEREAEAQRVVLAESQRSFDLRSGPLIAATLVRLSPTEHLLLLSMHQVIADSWSIGILRHELSLLYTAYTTGADLVLSDLPVQYADYALWQREWFAASTPANVLDVQLAYWRGQLHGLTALRLPTDYPRPAVATLRGAVQEFALSKALSTALAAVSRREGVSLFMTLLAGFQVLLYRYSGQDDVAVGTPIDTRRRGETENLIGYFLNTLVFRTSLAGTPTFHNVLYRVREVCLGAYAHQDLPFQQLVDALQPDRGMCSHGLFQAMFMLHHVPIAPLELHGLTVSPLSVEPTTTGCDLMLTMQETDQGLIGMLEYSTDLFASTTIAQMIDHLRVVLEHLVIEPSQGILSFPLLPHEHHHLVK
jgi:amino acid adenylation domain-containing protein